MKPAKYWLLLTCWLWFPIGALGAPVDSQTAAATVKGWLRMDRQPFGEVLGAKVKSVETFKDNAGDPLYHVVYLEPSGFVIVSAEDQTEPVIAFVKAGRYDPSPTNPLGALVGRDLPGRVAQARAHGGTPAALKNQGEWQKLQEGAQGGAQPMGVTTGSISDVRVAPFIQTYWDQGNLPTGFLTNWISVANEILVTTYFVTNALGDNASASVEITNTATMLITDGPYFHAFPGKTASVSVTNGPDTTVTNVIWITNGINIIVTNEFGVIIANQTWITNMSVTSIVSGTPGSVVTTPVWFTNGFILVDSDLKACYNYFTPPSAPGSTNNYVCGCVATAMAQLMYYFQWPATGVGNGCFQITVNGNPMGRNLRGGNGSGGPYDWKDMPLDPNYFSLTPLQAQSVGALTYDAGVAVKMQYASGGSGAYTSDARAALVSTFKYGNAILNAVTNLDTGCFECSLYNMMNPNLDARLPVLLGVTGDPGNHEIVVDGYGYCFGALYNHLNLGWGGLYTAWYQLPVIDMYNFTAETWSYFWEVTDCLYNVYTNGSGEIISGRVLDSNTGLPISGASVTAQRAGGGTYQAVTDAKGIYALAGVPSASTYTIAAANAGYFSTSNTYSTATSADLGTTSGNVWGADFSLVPAVGPPVITAQPQNQSVILGATATFSVAADGQLPLAYQWQYQASGSLNWNNLSDGGSYSGSETPTLTVSQTTTNLDGELIRCLVTNAVSAGASSQATLQVIVPVPVITTQPQDQTVTVGATATFSIAASSQLPLYYQWQYQPSGSLSWNNLSDGGNYSGSGTATLTVSQTATNMNGEPLQCIVSNAYVSVTSAPAILHVIVAPLVEITTIAGQAGTNGYADGTSSSALFNNPRGIAVDNQTNVYVADMYNQVIRQLVLSGTNWVASTIAGLAGTAGTNDGPGAAARFNAPYGVAVDSSTNVYVADTGNSTIRQLTPSGTNWAVKTISGLAGSPGTNDGNSSVARFRYPTGVAVDAGGNVYVADEGNATIRKLTPSGVNWMASTIAGTAGNFGNADGTNGAAQFEEPYGVAVDKNGIVYVVDKYSDTIRELTPSGINWGVTTIAGLAGSSGSADGEGSSARFNNPTGLAAGSDGDLYVADYGNNTIRRISPAGTSWMVFTVAGSAGDSGSTDGIGSAVRFDGPFGVAMDANTNIYVSDSLNGTIRMDPIVTVLAPPRVQLVKQQAGGSLMLAWSAMAGHGYQVQFKTNLNQSGWNNVTSVTPLSWTGAVPVPIGAGAQGFYRVVLVQ